MAEMPERPFCAGSGTAGRAGNEHQATAAGDEDTGARKEVVAKATMEEVLGAEKCREGIADESKPTRALQGWTG